MSDTVAGKQDISSYLRARRNELGLSRPEVVRRAARADMTISDPTIEGVERPGSNPTLKTLQVLAAVYGDDMEDYLRVAGYIGGEVIDRGPIDYVGAMERDERLRPSVREAVRRIIEAELNR